MSYEESYAYFIRRYRRGGRLGRWLARRDALATTRTREELIAGRI